ncbi:MAG: VOC family protein [Actinomycetota bacterium]|nr:VOC family protein [Actinomycetota bacterium]
MTDNTPAPTVWPCLSYSDERAAIRFLVEAFGFEETLVVPGDRDGEIVHVELRWPEGGGIMFGSGEGEFGRKPGSASLYVVTDQPDALFERATAAGAEVVRGLKDEDYGSRGFTVRDPEGNLWSFGTYRGA